jgi:hypothetical protein
MWAPAIAEDQAQKVREAYFSYQMQNDPSIDKDGFRSFSDPTTGETARVKLADPFVRDSEGTLRYNAFNDKENTRQPGPFAQRSFPRFAQALSGQAYDKLSANLSSVYNSGNDKLTKMFEDFNNRIGKIG